MPAWGTWVREDFESIVRWINKAKEGVYRLGKNSDKFPICELMVEKGYLARLSSDEKTVTFTVVNTQEG